MNELITLKSRSRDESRRPESEDPREILLWATHEFAASIALSTSLGPQTLVILDMLARLERLDRVHVFFLDTGLLFRETYELRRAVEARYGINIDAIRPRLDLYDQERTHGRELWRHDPDHCCHVRKVEPMLRALAGVGAYITGLRRDQSLTRQNLKAIGWDMRLGMTKINPLIGWTRAQVMDYLREYDVPKNPLLDAGYPSIGCQPCTSPVTLSVRRPRAGLGADIANDFQPDDVPEHVLDERAGRWADSGKTECGLHFEPTTTNPRTQRS